MAKALDIINEARTYLETPYQHQGRIKGMALDCVGLVVGLARFAEVRFEDCRAYDRYGRGSDLMDELRKWLTEIPIVEAKPADVIAFYLGFPNRATHAGIMTDKGLLHTHAQVRKVVEHRWDERWIDRRAGAFRFPTLEM